MKNEKLKKYLSKIQNPYKIKVENIVVTMEYTKNNKNFNECMVNILKQKLKNVWQINSSTIKRKEQ